MGEQFRLSKWRTLAVAFLLVSAALGAWVSEDRFIDREEAQHLLRTLETGEAAFGSATRGSSWSRLVLARIDQPKPWYGWPYYLVTAVPWTFTGPDYDVAVLLNVLFLCGAVVSVAAIGGQIGGAGAGQLAGVLILLVPGVLMWSHFFSPTIFLLATSTAAAALIVSPRFRTSPSWAFLGGATAALAAIAKLTTILLWLPLVPYALLRRRDATWSIGWRSLALFSLGFAPAVAMTVANLTVLRFWAEQVHSLWHLDSITELLRGVAMRNLETLLPYHLSLSIVGLVLLVLAGRPGTCVFFVGWFAAMCFGIVGMAGNSGTTREFVIAAVPLVLGAAVGIAALGDAWTIRFTRVSLAYGAIFVAINFFDLGRTRFDPSTQSILGLRPVLDGAPWGLRLTPYPDVLTRVVEQLDKLLPPGTPARCYCFSPKPYPIAASGQRPAVTFDSLLVGPENLEAALRLSGRQVPWALGYVPYPLTCSGFRVAADCASVSVSGGGAEGAYPSGERLAAERRRWLMENSSRWAVINLNGLPPIELRTPLSPAPCTSPEGSVLLSRLDSVLDGCPGDDYYRAALTGLLAPLERRANEVERARDLSLQRRRALDEGRFPSALVFGDAFLVDSTLRALKTTEGTNEPIVPPPLELGAFKVAWSGFRLSAPLMARRRVDASVTIRNAGTQTWPTALAVGAPHAVRLSYAWLDSEGRVVTPMVPRFELPHSLDPHQSLTMVLQIDGPPLPGEYVLKLDLVQELDTWFEEKGSEPLAVPVEVFP